MSQPTHSLDIRRAYPCVDEGACKHLELEGCLQHTYSFYTDENHRYIFIIDELTYSKAVGLKFYRAEDYENRYKYNILTRHKNPYRFFATIAYLIKKVESDFPKHAIVIIGEHTIQELENPNLLKNKGSKRFNFYKRFLSELIHSGKYEIKENINANMLVLIHRSFTQIMFDELEATLYSMGFSL